MSEIRETFGGRAPIFPAMDMDDDAFYRAFSMRDARLDGRVFVGVKTTGIYCRPICPARTPKRENVTFFTSAFAAQEAGFRPCLRCRPETSPDLAAWRGTSNTVSRALALIEEGALDTGDVDGLAGRLGVGERQLRRLFREHLGASPIAVAQTRRVLLAKQLLQETRLPMAEVALAAGFGSVRRFNEAFQQLFGRPPAALRRLGGAEVSGTDGAALSVMLPFRAPYDWDAMAGFFTERAITGVEVVGESHYARSFRVEGAMGVLRISPTDRDALRMTVWTDRLQAMPAIIARARRVFDLAADPQAIGVHLAADETLAPLVAARPGLRAPGAWDGFELAVRAILGQQVTVGAARNLAGKLAARFGSQIDHPAAKALGITHVFPSPEQLIGQDIAGLGMPQSRGRTLEAMARAAQAAPRLFGPKASLEAAISELCALPGIGEWTAQYIALRALREPDAFPHADVGLMRALAGPDGVRPTPAELEARAEPWRPWRAYAAQHLWAADAARIAERRSTDDRQVA